MTGSILRASSRWPSRRPSPFTFSRASGTVSRPHSMSCRCRDVRRHDPQRLFAIPGLLGILAAVHLAGVPAQDGAIEGDHLEMVAGHLDLEDQLAGLLDGRPGRGERGEDRGSGHEEEAVETDLGHVQSAEQDRTEPAKETLACQGARMEAEGQFEDALQCGAG
jgi:hypothetical protein